MGPVPRREDPAAGAVQAAAMSESSLRDLGGSRESLRAAIGKLDAATPASAGPAAAGVHAPMVRPAARWVVLLVLVAGATAALASLIAA